jgi:hypothetical protein
MNLTQARQARLGDRVVAKNGKYVQLGKIYGIESHHHKGFWFHFIWNSPNGKSCTARKRHLTLGMVCRHCGCTDNTPCTDPITYSACYWAEPWLCSSCVGKTIPALNSQPSTLNSPK